MAFVPDPRLRAVITFSVSEKRIKENNNSNDSSNNNDNNNDNIANFMLYIHMHCFQTQNRLPRMPYIVFQGTFSMRAQNNGSQRHESKPMSTNPICPKAWAPMTMNSGLSPIQGSHSMRPIRIRLHINASQCLDPKSTDRKFRVQLSNGQRGPQGSSKVPPKGTPSPRIFQ